MVRSIVVAAVLAGTSLLVLPPLAHAGGDPVPVCIAQGGTLRVIEKAEACRPGEQKKLLAEWEEEANEAPDNDADKDKENAALEKKVEELSARLEALEKKPDESRPDKTEALRVEELAAKVEALERASKTEVPGKTAARVSAPFEVVGSNGVVILRVAETVSSTSGQGARVTIGGGQTGNYGVRVHKDGDTFVAGIGQSTSGAGLAIVMDQSGEIAANLNGEQRRIAVYRNGNSLAGMIAEDRGGTIAVYENSGNPIAYLTNGSTGAGGNVTVAQNNGEGVFSAGAIPSGGGEACVNRMTGGGMRGSCLGIGLPGMGQGK